VALSDGQIVIVNSVALTDDVVLAVGENAWLPHFSDGRLLIDYLPGGTFVRLDPRSGAIHTTAATGVSFIPGTTGDGSVYIEGRRSLVEVDPSTGAMSPPIGFAPARYAFAVSGSRVWVTEGRNGVVHSLASVAAPTTVPSPEPLDTDLLGRLDCEPDDRWVSVRKVPFSKASPQESDEDAIRRVFTGIDPSDAVAVSFSEAGQFITVKRNGSVVTRVWLSTAGSDWLIEEVTGCASSGIRPPAP
jgi:hypothetical protein